MDEVNGTPTGATHAAMAVWAEAVQQLLLHSRQAADAERALVAAGFTQYQADEMVMTVVSRVIENGPSDYTGFIGVDGTWYEDTDPDSDS